MWYKLGGGKVKGRGADSDEVPDPFVYDRKLRLNVTWI
jgi:hypothetical protein